MSMNYYQEEEEKNTDNAESAKKQTDKKISSIVVWIGFPLIIAFLIKFMEKLAL